MLLVLFFSSHTRIGGGDGDEGGMGGRFNEFIPCLCFFFFFFVVFVAVFVVVVKWTSTFFFFLKWRSAHWH